MESYGCPCYRCGGKGTIQAIGDYPCWDCMGNGHKYIPGKGYDIFSLCRSCQGTGKVQKTYSETCPICGGRGY